MENSLDKCPGFLQSNMDVVVLKGFSLSFDVRKDRKTVGIPTPEHPFAEKVSQDSRNYPNFAESSRQHQWNFFVAICCGQQVFLSSLNGTYL
jgi:hypothetical protein